MKIKKAVVTGSLGFVGKHLKAQLEENNVEVIGVDIKNDTDLTDWEQVKRIGEADVLFHTAAKLFVPDSYINPREFYRTNILSTINALELCRLHKAKMVYISSYVYGEPRYLPIDENHPTSAFNPYAQSKIICEQICQGYNRDSGIHVTIFRPFNIYGIDQNDNFLIPSIIKQAKNGKLFLKDPSPKRDFLYVSDAVSAYIKSSELELGNPNFVIFNIGCGNSYSVEEIVHEVCLHFPKGVKVEFSHEKRKNEISNTVADISKAKRLLDWEPKISFKEGISLCVNSTSVS